MRAVRTCVAVLAASLSTSSCNQAGESTGPSGRAASMATGQAAADALPTVTLTCGAQVGSDARLDNDLACNGNGFTVSGDDITIDLNGHTLSGNGTGNGITVTAAHRVRIFGGSIRGFQSGIFVGSSTEVVVRDNEFSATNQAVLLQATTASIIKHNRVTNNLARAFMLRANLAGAQSTDNVVIDNVVIDTPTGVYLIRQPGNTIQGNTIVGATVAGVDLGPGTGQVSGTIVRANYLVGGNAGIRFSAGWIDNTIVGNRIEATVCAMAGPIANNTLNGNVLVGNTSDACP